MSDDTIAAELKAAGVEPAGSIEHWKDVARGPACNESESVLRLQLAMQKDKGQEHLNRALRVAAVHMCPDRVAVIDEQIASMR